MTPMGVVIWPQIIPNHLILLVGFMWSVAPEPRHESSNEYELVKAKSGYLGYPPPKKKKKKRKRKYGFSNDNHV